MNTVMHIAIVSWAAVVWSLLDTGHVRVFSSNNNPIWLCY